MEVHHFDEKLRCSFQSMHQGYPLETLERFLQAREGNVLKANKMKVITPNDVIRDSQLIGFSGFCKKGRPVFVLGVGRSGYDRAPLDKYVKSHIQLNEYRDRVLLPEATKHFGRYVGSCLKILDMTGLKLSSLHRLKILTAISTVDDLNYPEKTDAYYIVNAPFVFTACWKAVKPLLQERTKRKVQVLHGCGRDELLKVMDQNTIPQFCRLSSKELAKQKDPSLDMKVNYFSPSHPFHLQLCKYIEQRTVMGRPLGHVPQPSFCVTFPEPDDDSTEVVHVIESTLERLAAAKKGMV